MSAEPDDTGRVEIAQQPDGSWRWRWLPDDFAEKPLVSAHSFDSCDEAEDSARSAYPTSRVVLAGDVPDPDQHRGHTARRLFGCSLLLGVAALTVAVVLARRARP